MSPRLVDIRGRPRNQADSPAALKRLRIRTLSARSDAPSMTWRNRQLRVRFLPGSPIFASLDWLRRGRHQPDGSALRARQAGRFLPGSPTHLQAVHQVAALRPPGPIHPIRPVWHSCGTGTRFGAFQEGQRALKPQRRRSQVEHIDETGRVTKSFDAPGLSAPLTLGLVDHRLVVSQRAVAEWPFFAGLAGQLPTRRTF
jgi:hypothetical protein